MNHEESRGIKIKAIRAGKKHMGKLMRNLQVILLYSMPKEAQVWCAWFKRSKKRVKSNTSAKIILELSIFPTLRVIQWRCYLCWSASQKLPYLTKQPPSISVLCIIKCSRTRKLQKSFLALKQKQLAFWIKSWHLCSKKISFPICRPTPLDLQKMDLVILVWKKRKPSVRSYLISIELKEWI